jgi:hypothetical protein
MRPPAVSVGGPTIAKSGAMRWILNSVLLVSVLSGRAFADGAPPTVTAAAERAREWYGWQTLLVDGAAVGLTVALANSHQNVAGAVFAGGYVLGGPAVHLAHGHRTKAGGSLALRLAAPLLGGMIGGVATAGCDSDKPPGERGECGGIGLATGATLGLLAAILTDSIWLAREPAAPPREERQLSLVSWRQVGLLPALGSTRTGTGLGLAGSF